MLNATAPPARTTTPTPAITHGRLLRALGPTRVLQRLRQACDHLLGGGQFLGDRFLSRSDFPGQPALLVPATELRRGRLRGLDAQADNPPRDVHRSHCRVGQAAGQSLPRGQPGFRLRAHLPPFCAAVDQTASIGT